MNTYNNDDNDKNDNDNGVTSKSASSRGYSLTHSLTHCGA